MQRRERDAEVQVPQILGPLGAAEALVDARVAGPEDERRCATRREEHGRRLGRRYCAYRRAHGVLRLRPDGQRDGVKGVAREGNSDLVAETPARGNVYFRELLAVPRDFRAVAHENGHVVPVPERRVDDRLAQVSRRGYD